MGWQGSMEMGKAKRTGYTQGMGCSLKGLGIAQGMGCSLKGWGIAQG